MIDKPVHDACFINVILLRLDKLVPHSFTFTISHLEPQLCYVADKNILTRNDEWSVTFAVIHAAKVN